MKKPRAVLFEVLCGAKFEKSYVDFTHLLCYRPRPFPIRVAVRDRLNQIYCLGIL